MKPQSYRVGEAGHQRFGQCEHAQVRIEVQLAGGSARGFDHGIDMSLVSAQVGIFKRFGILTALRGAYRVGHVRSSHADRLRRTRCGVSGGLVLYLGIEFGPEQDNDRRNPEPRHESDRSTKRTVGLVELAETRGVP